MKKYAPLYPPLVARVFAEEAAKKDPVKSAKTRLHQIYGAYAHHSAYKKTEMIIASAEGSLQRSGAPLPLCRAASLCVGEAILRLHASTRERLSRYPEFYAFIFNHIPPPASVLDLGCGFNPYSLPYLLNAYPDNHPPPEVYHALDIDTRQAELLNRFFVLHGLPPAAGCADLAAASPGPELPPADLTFMFKLLPVLEAQAPDTDGGFRLARRLKSKHLVITYPLKSLGGKEKGMARHYRHTFETAYGANGLSPFSLLAEGQIGNEWLYLLKS
jgi:16S rRNA (guanine(1405)-N(7))-methyltransferase